MDVWKRSSRLSVNIYSNLSDLKDFGFRDQITRSSLSVPSNIAEGFERATGKDKRNFLNYSKGSCAELKDPNLYRYGNWLYSKGIRQKLGQGNRRNLLHAHWLNEVSWQ